MNLFSTIVGWSDRIKNGRTDCDVMRSIDEEASELRAEVLIAAGLVSDPPGADGKFGEAIDIICSAVDMVRRQRPDMTVEELEAEVAAYADRKCQKWAEKYS